MGRVDVDTSRHHIDVDHIFALDFFGGGGPEGSSEDKGNFGLSEAVVGFLGRFTALEIAGLHCSLNVTGVLVLPGIVGDTSLRINRLNEELEKKEYPPPPRHHLTVVALPLEQC